MPFVRGGQDGAERQDCCRQAAMALQVLQGDRDAQDRQRRKAAQDLPELAVLVQDAGRGTVEREDLQAQVRQVLGDATDTAADRRGASGRVRRQHPHRQERGRAHRQHGGARHRLVPREVGELENVVGAHVADTAARRRDDRRRHRLRESQEGGLAGNPGAEVRVPRLQPGQAAHHDQAEAAGRRRALRAGQGPSARQDPRFRHRVAAGLQRLVQPLGGLPGGKDAQRGDGQDGLDPRAARRRQERARHADKARPPVHLPRPGANGRRPGPRHEQQARGRRERPVARDAEAAPRHEHAAARQSRVLVVLHALGMPAPAGGDPAGHAHRRGHSGAAQEGCLWPPETRGTPGMGRWPGVVRAAPFKTLANRLGLVIHQHVLAYSPGFVSVTKTGSLIAREPASAYICYCYNWMPASAIL